MFFFGRGEEGRKRKEERTETSVGSTFVVGRSKFRDEIGGIVTGVVSQNSRELKDPHPHQKKISLFSQNAPHEEPS